MKISLLSLAIHAAVLLTPADTVRADCPPATNIAVQRSPQTAALTWQIAPGADSILCYRWTLVQQGWRCDWQRVLSGDTNSLVDTTLGQSKTYEYGIAVHYPDCGWASWQYIIVGPSSASSKGSGSK